MNKRIDWDNVRWVDYFMKRVQQLSELARLEQQVSTSPDLVAQVRAQRAAIETELLELGIEPADNASDSPFVQTDS